MREICMLYVFMIRYLIRWLKAHVSVLARVNALVVIMVLVTAPQVSALSAAQKQLMDSGVSNFNLQDDATCGSPTSGAIGPLTGSTEAEKVYNFFVGVGLAPFQAAAIMGNMLAESGIQPQRLQGTASGVVTPAEQAAGSPKGWGLVQWTPAGKFINTQSPVANANDIGAQLAFLWDQLNGRGPIPEKQAGDDVKAAPSIEEAVVAFQGNMNVGGKYRGYERPANESASVPQRLAAAKQYLALYGSNTVQGSVPLPTVAPSSACPAAAASTVSTPGGTAIPTGDTKTLAMQIAASTAITFQTKQDSDYFSEVISTGRQSACGGATISPTLLGVILKLSQSYKIVLGVFDTGHGCDGGFHPKGAAVDINGVNPLDGSPGGTGNQIRFTAGLPLLKQFYQSAGEVLAANGGGGLGEQQCFGGPAPKVAGVTYFDDTCNHIHMDTRGK